MCLVNLLFTEQLLMKDSINFSPELRCHLIHSDQHMTYLDSLALANTLPEFAEHLYKSQEDSWQHQILFDTCVFGYCLSQKLLLRRRPKASV